MEDTLKEALVVFLREELEVFSLLSLALVISNVIVLSGSLRRVPVTG
jgi:hypothetical protein